MDQGNDPIASHDSAIRQHMGEIVRTLMNQGQTARLAEILHQHKEFIESILDLLEGKQS